MENHTKKRFSEFPPVMPEQWEAQIQKDLKGADYDKKLVWRPLEGFAVKPYYTAADLANINWLKTYPGEFPYVRGNQASGNNWLVRQDIKVTDIKEANEKALDILMKGVDSLGFELDCKKQYTLADIELLLKNIRADIAEINFLGTDQHQALVTIIEQLVKKYNRPMDKIHGSVNFDPIMRFSRRGVWYKGENDDFDTAHALVKSVQSLPVYRVIGVNGHIFTNAGATIVQEIACSLAVGAEYLTRLTNKGLFIGEITPHMKFNLAIGPNYFMEMAKLRAYRLLWAKITNAYGLNDARNGRLFVHATNSSWNYTTYDPYVNMLRSTTGTMSALLGGIDSFKVLPFDMPFEQPTDFAERVARNQQLILKEESYLDKVADPASGSYYIENLTHSIVEAAWKLFLDIQEEGGFLAALKNGSVQRFITESARKKDLNLATRREIMLGTNQYPNFNETISSDLPEQVFAAEDKTSAGAEIETIKTYRGAQAFERLRYKTDIYSRTAPRPKAWMFTFGNLAMLKARSNFASNFFACAGFEVTDNPGFASIDEGIRAAREVKPDIVVICSSDEAYAESALPIFEALRDQGIVVLAGYPAELVDQLKQGGMTHFIHMKSNVLETLQQFQQLLGIA